LRKILNFMGGESPYQWTTITSAISVIAN
jgi:hypothetical protein